MLYECTLPVDIDLNWSPLDRHQQVRPTIIIEVCPLRIFCKSTFAKPGTHFVRGIAEMSRTVIFPQQRLGNDAIIPWYRPSTHKHIDIPVLIKVIDRHTCGGHISTTEHTCISDKDTLTIIEIETLRQCL